MRILTSLFIGYRYWRSRKSNAFASFITFFAVSGIFLGVAALIIIATVMNGLEGQLKQRILDVVPQMTVSSSQPLSDLSSLEAQLTTLPMVKGVLPHASTQAMLQSTNNIAAVQLYGIEPAPFNALSGLAAHTFVGQLTALEAGAYQVLLGEQLARQLGVNLGDQIRILSGDGVVYSPLGPVPSQRKFVVGGIFSMGSVVDSQVAYVHYQDARRLMRQTANEVNQLRLYFNDPYQAPEHLAEIQRIFDAAGTSSQTEAQSGGQSQVQISDWRESYGQLFAAVKMEKAMMSLMISLIIAVAAFNIVSALIMMVNDKTADIAILKTQGMSETQVMFIFLWQGSLNALLGLLLGIVVGVSVALNMNELLMMLGISLLGPGQLIPTELDWTQLLSLVIGTLGLTLIATSYPALRASKVQPAQALRYE